MVNSPGDGELVIGTQVLSKEVKEDLEALLFKSDQMFVKQMPHEYSN